MCDAFSHEFKEEYYGNRCTKCGLFYPFGCAPWDENYDYAPEEYYPDDEWFDNHKEDSQEWSVE